MAFIESTYLITLTSGGGTVNLSVNDPYQKYSISGSATLAASYVIQPSGTPQTNTKFVFEYDATITLNSNTLTIFGLSLTDSQALQSCTITSCYNGSTWDTQLDPDFENSDIVETFNIVDRAITNQKLATGSISSIKILNGIGEPADLQLGNNHIPIGNGSTVTSILLNDITDNQWHITGNAGTDSSINFIGTTDNVDLVFRVNNLESGRISTSTNKNTSLGYKTLFSITSGTRNTAFGLQSLMSNTSGSWNTAIGIYSLTTNTTGGSNTVLGAEAMNTSTSASANTVLGSSTASTLTTGNNNTIIGYQADVDSSSSTNRIALGKGSNATADYQFAIPDDVTTIKFKGLTYTLPTSLPSGDAVLHCDASGVLTWV